MIFKTLALGLPLAFIYFPSSAYALEVLDQEFARPLDAEYFDIVSGFTRSDFIFRRAQTVTAGMAGNLTGIEIFAAGGPDDIAGMNILEVDANGVPTTTVIASASLVGDEFSQSGGWIRFTTFLPIIAGQVFALEPLAAENSFPGWFGAQFDFATYAGGSDFFINTGVQINDFRENASSDNYFRTFVTTGAVPEPGSWAMLIVGFGAVGYSMRRRRYAVKGLLAG